VATGRLSVETGPVGSSVTVSGNGFTADTATYVTYDDNPVATANADKSGGFSAAFIVPASTGGAHTVVATDGKMKVSFVFSVVASVLISPSQGYVGTPVTISGSGFTAGTKVTVRYDADQIASSTTNAVGGFAVTFDAPASRVGGHSIIIAGDVNVVSAVFAIESTPPPAPELLSPSDSTQVNAVTEFEWSAVTDPNGVTYTLQIARNAGFSDLVVEKKGLATTAYQLTEEERLKPASKQQPYYWRVKAVNGAFSESPWTSPQSFFVGFVLATWAYYLIGGGAAVVAGLSGYWLGTRMRRQSPQRN
jgi:hypothetical protein